MIATLKRAPSELSSYQRKIFKIDDHLGIAISGLTADGRILCRYMRNECLNHRYVYESAMPVGRLVRQVADRAQVGTQRSWKRPYGVGLMSAGYDEKTGAHIYYNCPSGNYYEYKAFAMGSRSQAAKTYMERRVIGGDLDREAMGMDGLIRHTLKALHSTIQDGDLNEKNCTVAVVGGGAAVYDPGGGESGAVLGRDRGGRGRGRGRGGRRGGRRGRGDGGVGDDCERGHDSARRL